MTVQATRIGSAKFQMPSPVHSQKPPTTSGIATIRRVLSALPDTMSFVVGSNLTAVGGNSCAFNTVHSGWEKQS